MEEATQALVVVPDLQNIQNTLHNDYKNHLVVSLEHYKKANSFSQKELVSAARAIRAINTGPNCYPVNSIANDILATKDNQGNHFIHIAVDKEHTSVVEQLTGMRAYSTTMRNDNGETAFDTCIKKMSVQSTYTSTIVEILDVLLNGMVRISRSLEENRTFLKTSLQKLIALQLEYKKLGKELLFKNELLLKLINNDISEEDERTLAIILLSRSYQRTVDETNGATFTHLLVQQELPDELFEWIKQERVSLAKNKAGLTPVDTALERFRQFTHNGLTMPTNDSFQKRRCCLFMLLNYCKTKSEQSAETHFANCCDKHIISQ